MKEQAENKNQKIEELTDEQLNKVAGGLGGVVPTCVYFSIPGCVKRDKDCHCTECAKGFVLVSGKCEYQKQL